MNTTSLLLTTNDRQLTTRQSQNKPNSNPIKPNYEKVKMPVNNVSTFGYENFRLQECTDNKANQTQLSIGHAKVIPPNQGKYPVLRLNKTLRPSIKNGMINLEFEKDQAQIFEHAGLKSFEDFFSYADGRLIGQNRNNKREVIAMTLDSEVGKKEFFMKRFFRPHFKDMFFAIRNFGKLCSQAGCEWKNTDILLRQGITTYRPVCYGEKMRLGLEEKSFIITEKIEGLTMTDFVGANWPRFGCEQREKLIIALAKFVRRIHNAKIILPDLYLWHIFITKAPVVYDITEDDLAVIDLHRMRVNVSDKNAPIKDLSALDFSMSDKYFDEGIREVFLNAYINTDDRDRMNLLLDRIKNRSRKLAHRRRRPDY